MSTRFFESGDIETGSGQLGTMVTFTTVTTSFSIVPGVDVIGLAKYYDVYNIETSTNGLTITMPSPSDVPVGWRCKFVVSLNPIAGPIGTLTINDNLAAPIYVFNSTRNLSSATASLIFSSAEFLLRDSMPTWTINPDVFELANNRSSIAYNTNGYPMRISGPLLGRAIGQITNTATNINVLFATPVTVQFTLDQTYYSDFVTYSFTSSLVTLNRTGLYNLVFNIRKSPNDATPWLDMEFNVLLNGIFQPASITRCDNAINNNNSSAITIKSIFYGAASDTIGFIIGFSILPVGFITMIGNFVLEYLGS